MTVAPLQLLMMPHVAEHALLNSDKRLHLIATNLSICPQLLCGGHQPRGHGGLPQRIHQRGRQAGTHGATHGRG